MRKARRKKCRMGRKRGREESEHNVQKEEL
jgi:hypothetical protein